MRGFFSTERLVSRVPSVFCRRTSEHNCAFSSLENTYPGSSSFLHFHNLTVCNVILNPQPKIRGCRWWVSYGAVDFQGPVKRAHAYIPSGATCAIPVLDLVVPVKQNAL